MLTFLWHSVLGLVLLTGATIGGVVMIARAITKGAEHDFNRCMCPQCQQRRYKAWEKHHERNGTQTPTAGARGLWVATEHLTTGLHVGVKGHTYKVTELQPIPDYGISVHLRDTRTGRETMVMIRDVQKKIWKRVSWDPMERRV